MASSYQEFLDSKQDFGAGSGFEPIEIPSFLFPFQAHLCAWQLRRGRGEIMAGCGLGKSPMEYVIADNVVRKTNGRVLLLTPLSVGGQMVREGEKFGFESEQSRDGKFSKKIVVTNYEKLHLFNPADFSGVICDECFSGDTFIDTPEGEKRIKDIRVGDLIMNASGVDAVSNVHRREVQHAVKVSLEGSVCISSPNHPFFTQRGWVGAQHLRDGDYALVTDAAVRLVRKKDLSEEFDFVGSTILRDILLSEMADETTGDSFQDPQSGSSSQKGIDPIEVPQIRKSFGPEGHRENSDLESNVQSGDEREGLAPIERDEVRTFRAWRKREGDDYSGADIDGCVGVSVGSVQYIVGSKDSRLSNLLQGGLREHEIENRNRGGWKLASQSSGSGSQEGRNACFARVEGAEILESGNPELEQHRSPDGKLYFYDLGGTRHPSFSVGGCLVHNSSILKNCDGVIRGTVTEFMRTIPYRTLCTATATPNDYDELGTSSEALGYLGYQDMVTRFFIKQTGHDHLGWARTKLKLRGHAERDYWRWVCSWARACRKPSDLGFDDTDYILPGLITREHIVEAKQKRAGFLFDMPAITLGDQKDERRRTIRERCEKVAELVSHGRSAIAWCHLNPEGDLLERMIPGCVQVSGKDSDEAKEEKILAFTSGQASVMVSKPKILGWGHNFQFCAHHTFFPSHSFEQTFQAFHRSYRFGQTEVVTMDMVTTEGELGVLENYKRKHAAYDQMFAKLVENMNEQLSIQRRNPFAKVAASPAWLQRRTSV